MNNLKKKAVVLMIVLAILICIIFVISTNIIARKYVVDEAKMALNKEFEVNKNFSLDGTNKIGIEVYDDEKNTSNIAIPLDESISFIKDEGIKNSDSIVINNSIISTMEENKNLFNVNYLWLGDIGNTKIENYMFFSKDDINVYKLYVKGIFSKDEIKDGTIDGRTYYGIITSFEEKLEENTESTDILLYIEVSNVMKIVNNLNTILIVLTLICIVIMGIIGLRVGEYIENSQKKLKHFFENASHELKTPLMSIQGYAEGIKTGVVDSEMASDIIIRQSDKMKHLINEILNLSKLDSGQLIMNKNEIDIYELLEDIISGMPKKTKQGKVITIKNCIPEEIGIIVGDELQLNKAFSTIISNAFKYTNNKIYINAKIRKRNIQISIKDNGKGIEKKHLPYIFDRFYSENNISSGIGLAMAKEIIVKSKGSIKVENENGANFIIELPKL